MAKDRSFVNRRLHSLLGVIPLGVFLLLHLATNYTGTEGPEAFREAAQFMDSVPFIWILEWVIVFIPITFHAVYGVYIAFQSRNNPKRYSFYQNILFTFQRVTGLITFVFVAWHIWETRVQKAFGVEVNFDMMANILDNVWMIIFYVVGVLSAVFHFSNGLWAFLITWGITIGPKAQKVSAVVCMLIFVVLSILFMQALFAFTGTETAMGLN